MNRNFVITSLSLFVWGLGEGLFILFQPIYLLELGAQTVEIGIIFSGMGLMSTLSQVPAGYLSDRFGARRLMWFSWVFGTIAAILMAVAPSLPLFVIALWLYGFTGSVLAPMNSYITSVRGSLTTERALTITSAAYNLGAVIGPTIGGLIANCYELKIIYSIAAIMFILSSSLIFLIKKPDKGIHLPQGEERNLIHNNAFIRLLAFGFSLLFFMVFTQNFSTVYLQDIKNFNLQQIGYLGTIGNLGNVVLALTLGNLPSTTGLLVSIPITFLFPFLLLFGNGFGWIGLAYFSFGGYRLTRSMLLAESRRLINPSELGLAYGFIETANGLALILAPLLCGIIYNHNPDTIFLISMGGLFILGLISVFFRSKRGKDTDDIKNSTFYAGTD